MRSCSWLPKIETSSFAKFSVSIVGSSSNSVEIGGAAPMLSPVEIATVAGFAARSAAQLLVRSGAPKDPPTSIAPCRSLSCRTCTALLNELPTVASCAAV